MDVEDRAGKEAIAAELELEIAEVCGVMNAATSRLVGLIARVLETESWQGWGIRSASHCGLEVRRVAGPGADAGDHGPASRRTT